VPSGGDLSADRVRAPAGGRDGESDHAHGSLEGVRGEVLDLPPPGNLAVVDRDPGVQRDGRFDRGASAASSAKYVVESLLAGNSCQEQTSCLQPLRLA
jgi:hypothetical protein